MKYEVDLTKHQPAYTQILEQVKHAIATGELKPGDQLPTVRQLAADLRVNFNTVARAYRLLDEEGIISTQHGRGTYILGPATARDTKRLRQKELALLAEYFVEEAEKLGFTPKEVRSIIEDQVNVWDAELKSKSKGDS
jgi:GntR family transcriptional regulator